MIVFKEELNWTTAYTYKLSDGKNYDATLPYGTLKKLCEKHRVSPDLGAKEASFESFRDWLYKHRKHKEQFYGKRGFDIDSLVDLFDDDLKVVARIDKDNEKMRKAVSK